MGDVKDRHERAEHSGESGQGEKKGVVRKKPRPEDEMCVGGVCFSAELQAAIEQAEEEGI
jgi:hypothetical protein